MPNPKRSVNWDDILGSDLAKRYMNDAKMTNDPVFGGGGVPQMTRKVLGQYTSDPGFNKYLDFTLGPEQTQFINQNWQTLPPNQQEALYKLLRTYSQMYQSVHK